MYYTLTRIHNNKSLFYGQTVLKLVKYKKVLLNSLQFNYYSFSIFAIINNNICIKKGVLTAMYCKNCGSQVSESKKFCTKCGTPIQPIQPTTPANNICINCGNEIRLGKQFCSHCGTSVNIAQSTPISPSNVCPICRYNNDIDKKFCIKCGSQILYKQPLISKRKNPNKAIKITAITAGLLAFIMVVNFVLFPFINRRYNMSLGIFNEYGTNMKSLSDDSSPKVGKEIARAQLSEDNLTITAEEENVSMTISDYCIDVETTAIISKIDTKSVSDTMDIAGYNFTLDTEEPVDGVILIEIPYDESQVAEGFTPEECIVGLYYNQEIGQWVNTHYEIDEERQMVIISTTHLTGFGVGSYNAPGVNTKRGIQTFGSSDIWNNSSVYGDFFTSPNGDLKETVFGYDMTSIKFKHDMQDNSLKLQQMSNSGLSNSSQVTIDNALSFLGTASGYPENMTTLAIETGYKGAKREALNKSLGKFGGALVLFQLASDLYYGKSGSATAFSFLKGMVYWKGSAAATFVLGATVGSYIAIALVGLFTVEQIIGPLESWNDDQFEQQQQHHKLFAAYQLYYDNKPKKGARRTTKEWYEKILELNNTALSAKNIEDGKTKEQYFEELLKKEIDEYINKFWQLPLDTRAQMVVDNTHGFLYGSWDMVHYAGNPNDSEMSLYDYIDKVRDGDYPGISLTLSEGYLIRYNTTAFHKISYASNLSQAKSYMGKVDSGTYKEVKDEIVKHQYNDLVNNKILPLMNRMQKQNYLKSEDELNDSIFDMMINLNSTIKLNYVDESAEELEKPLYANHIIVPNSKSITDQETMKKWSTVLDKEGKGTIEFTTLAHLKVGSFTQVSIYKPEDKDKLNKAEPVRIVDIIIEDSVNEIKIKLEEDYVGSYKGTIQFKEYTDNYKKLIGVTLDVPDCDVTVDIDKENKVTVRYTMMSSGSYEIGAGMAGDESVAVQKFDSTLNVELTGEIKSNDFIIIDTVRQDTITVVTGEMYEGGSQTIPSNLNINLTIQGKVVKKDSSYVIQMTITDEYAGYSNQIKVDLTKQVTFD